MRRGFVLLFLVVAAVLVARPAWAHVDIEPEEAPRGATVDLTFRVPNEKDDASTTRVEIAFPTDHPIATARPQPVARWEESVQMSGDNVGSVLWTGGAIPPDGEERFVVSVGPLPSDADRLVFKALQTYDNGEVVRWIEEPLPGGEEPEHPAPVLTLTGPRIATTTSAAPTTAVAPTTVASGEADDDDAANVGLIVGIAAAVLFTAVGVTAAIRGRRRSS